MSWGGLVPSWGRGGPWWSRWGRRPWGILSRPEFRSFTCLFREDLGAGNGSGPHLPLRREGRSMTDRPIVGRLGETIDLPLHLALLGGGPRAHRSSMEST